MSSNTIEEIIRNTKEFKAGDTLTTARVNSILLGCRIKVDRQHIIDCLNRMTRNGELWRDGKEQWRAASPAKKWLRARWGKQ